MYIEWAGQRFPLRRGKTAIAPRGGPGAGVLDDRALAIAADAQLPVDFLILGGSDRRGFVAPRRQVSGPRLAVADRGLPPALDLPGGAIGLSGRLRTAARSA